MPASPLIAAESLTVTRQGKRILNEVSLAVGERDFITVIGPNGAGKSMLLKCLMGFYAPDSGTVRRREDTRIGYVPQRFVPDPVLPISVRRFLCLRKHADARALHGVVEETGIDAVLEEPLHVLSGGELQRVLLARALLDGPALLALDEPAQNLDISGQLAFYKLLERIYAERAVSILMVSHDLHMVMASTRQVVCLFHHVCCEGKPEEVSQHPEFINLFGRDMSDMLRVYTHTHNHRHEEHRHD
jgi:zinc transport system ATP-binding protein